MLNKEVMSRLHKLGIPTNNALPNPDIIEMREAPHVAKRMTILCIFLAISHDITSIDFFGNYIKEQGLADSLSVEENKILEKGKLTQQQEIDLTWYQESLYALTWCLGIVSYIDPPTEEANLLPIFPYLPPEIEVERFTKEAKLINELSISEELSFYYGLHWAVKHPESWSIFSRRKSKKYNVSIVKERRRALEWIVDASLDWDDVPLDT